MNKCLLALSSASLCLLVACSPKTDSETLNSNGVESNLATDLEEVLNEKVESNPSLSPTETPSAEESLTTIPTEDTESEESAAEEAAPSTESEEDNSVGQEDKVIPEFPLDMDTPKTDSKEE